MTKKELAEAVAIAKGTWQLRIDDSVLHGLLLPAFQPVTTTLEVVAKFLRWHCMMLNGEWDSEALNEMANALRRKVQIV